jgi:hypothetical protein
VRADRTVRALCLLELLVLGMVLFAAGAQARSLNLVAGRLQNPHLKAQALQLTIDERASGAALRLAVERVEAIELGLDGRLDWHCKLRRVSGDSMICEGPVTLVTVDGSEQTAELATRVGTGKIELALSRAGSHVSLMLPFAQAPVRASMKDVPATWLKAPLARQWPGGELRGGRFDIEAALHPDGHVEVDYAAAELAFNTLDGTISGDRLKLAGHLRTASGPQARKPHESGVVLDAAFAGGTLGMGAMQVILPPSPVDANLVARVDENGRYDIERFTWRDAGTLELEASGSIDSAALAPLRKLHVRIAQLRLPQASERYARAILLAQGLAGISFDGDISGELDIDAGSLQRVTLSTAKLDIHDAARDLEVSGVRGGIDWATAGERPASSLAWKAATVGGISLPASSTRWQSRHGVLYSLDTLQARVLGGQLKLSQTILHPMPGADGERISSAFSLEGIGQDSADGDIAAADVSADGHLRLAIDAGSPRLRLDARLRGGEVLVGPLYIKLPAEPVALALDVRAIDAGWQIDAFDWSDPGTLAFSANGQIVPADPKPLQSLRLDLREAQLGPALQRYAQSWLATKGYGDLSATGSLSGRVDLATQGLRSFAFVARGVNVLDGGGRFAFSGLDGSVDWDLETERPATTLGWSSLELFDIPLGPARAALRARDGQIDLLKAVEIDVLGGQWRLEKLGLQPNSPRGERYTGSFAIAGIEMAQLSDALGWPRFGGSLSGGIPEIEFSGDTIQLHGGLDLYVFDGHLGVSGLSLERPFGVAPSLGANIHFQGLDLEQVTSAFSFGGMSGRLDGTIANLRLVDWSPVAFDAWLRTRGGGRMSYNAVNDLTSIGGGGLSANLQTMALKLFDTFGYRRLGIRCTLRDEVCAMGGLEPLPVAGATDSGAGGYTIVEGAGVPRITIVGHRRRVDWPTLLSRLQEATRGQGPVVE